MKKFVPLAMLAAILLAVPPAASAAPPPTAPDLLATVDAGQGCDFALEIAGTDAKARVKTFANGKQITSGKGYLLTYTNAETGESVTFETNGTAQTISAPDADNVVTVMARGSNGLVLFPSDVSGVEGVEAPSAIQYTGRIVYTVDLDTGVFTLVSASGKQRDLCAELS